MYRKNQPLRLAPRLLSSRHLRLPGALPGDKHPTTPNGRQRLPSRHLKKTLSMAVDASVIGEYPQSRMHCDS